MSEVRTFKAASMQEALDLVRQEMGSEAVILHTRQISQRRLLPWKKKPQEVEITAGLGMNIPPRVTRQFLEPKQPVKTASTKSRRSVRSNHVNRNATTSQSFKRRLNELNAAVTQRPAPDSQQVTGPEGDTVSFSSRIVPSASAPPRRRQPRKRTSPPEMTSEVANKLDAIQKMIENLGRTSRLHTTDDIPSELFQLYTDLIDAEVNEDTARELIDRLRENATAQQLGNITAAKALLSGIVESDIRCCGPIVPTPGRRKVVALVGATGVGKTTTIAKLAANFRLRDNVKIGLVTVDTYRIAAVEQLRTYAEIIDLPMKVVTSAPEMRRALDELTGLDLVLIDTAGRSPRDDLQIQELKSLLSEANVDEVHLVLSMTSSMRSLEATAGKFANAAKLTGLIMTKLDEAAGMGTMFSLARKLAMPISYLTTGQDVPDDIEVADPGRISRLVLGREKSASE